MDSTAGIALGHSGDPDARGAVRDFRAQVAQADLSLVVFFCSPRYDLGTLAEELAAAFDGVPVVGCTTAGEIGPAGYRDHSLSGVSFSASSAVAATGVIGDLGGFEAAQGRAVAADVLARLRALEPATDGSNAFALLLTDGLSGREEPVARSVQSVLGSIPVMGGSAGDGTDFATTHVYADGVFRSGIAALAVVHTALPLVAFQTQHFESTDRRVVVTGADPERRLITEIDGLPAAEAYAALLGLAGVSELDPARYAAHPLVVRLGGTEYVRGIQQVGADGSLALFGAIEEGVVLRVAQAGDLIADLDRAFHEIRSEIGAVQVILGCDCVLRKHEVLQDGILGQVSATLAGNRVVGFSGYGEQYRGVHVNQTFSGVAIGHAHV